jgi:flagellar biosynthesis protein FlhB
MASEQERKHPPTAARRRRAVQEGRVPQSRLLLGAIVLLGFTMLLPAIASMASQILSHPWHAVWRDPTGSVPQPWLDRRQALSLEWLSEAFRVWWLIALAMGAVWLLTIIGTFMIRRQLVARWQAPGADASWMDRWQRPMQWSTWLQQLWSGGMAMGLAAIGLLVLYGLRHRIAQLGLIAPEQTAAGLMELFPMFGRWLAALLLLLGAADYAWQWVCIERSMWMTDEELREEMEQSRARRSPHQPGLSARTAGAGAVAPSEATRT